MLLVNNDHVPTVSLPLFLIVSFARIYKTVTCDTICTADDHVKIACKEGASKGDNIYTKILIRKFIWLVYVFKNSVFVFICKLANQRRQRLYIHRFYSHIQVRKFRKEYCCAPLHRVTSFLCPENYLTLTENPLEIYMKLVNYS